MKNLKRALSLVLSTAMLAGMMVVGTGAAFADVKAEHNEEAIAVVSAAGIMGANEEFNPDANITRNEMAVVMVNMLGLDTKDYAGASNFTDVPAWAADYVDACYANGIVSGTSATTYNGSANVTTAEAALMMLKALGYYEEAKLNDWLLDTIKTASKIDLLDGIDAKATAKLTRNEVAQLALNALEANTVEETANGSNTSIKGEDIEITVDSSVTIDDELKTKYDYDGESEYEQLIEKLFKDRFEKDSSGWTKLGLPATVWYDNDEDEEIIFVADEADKVITVTNKSKDITALYVDKVDEDFEGTVDCEKQTVVSGDVVYFYEDEDEDGNDIVNAYVLTYTLGQITEIEDEVRTADKKEGVSAYVYIDDVKYLDTEIAGFDAETYVEDAYVLYIAEKGEVLASELAEVVEGEIRGTRDGKFKIDGTYYTDRSGSDKLVKGADVKVVLNMAGQIALVDDAELTTSSDYIYIYNSEADDEGYTTDDGVKVDETVVTVWGVLADGTKVKYVVADATEEIEVGVYAYSIDDDELVIEKETDVIAKFAGATLDKDNKGIDGVYANADTEFVFVSKDDKKMVVTTATGIKNVNIDADVYAIYDEDDKDMIVVFVEAEEAELEIDADYAILVDDAVSEDLNDDDKVEYTYTVSIDGEETTLTFEKAQELSVIGTIFTYEMEGDYAVNVKIVEKAPLENVMTIDRVGEDFYVIDGDEYTMADDADEYTITFTFDEDADADSVDMDDVDEIEVATKATLKKDAKVVIVADEDDMEIEAIFVIKTVR